MIRVLIADDQAVIREGLRFIVEHDSEIKVVGCATNGNEAFELCGRLQPDVVMMDVVMPVCDGVEGTRRIKETYSGTKVLILTTFNDDEKISQALRNGADGYVLKDVDSDELLLTIKSINKGLRVIHEDAYGHLLKKITGANTAGEPYPVNDPGLTEREIEITKMIVFGKSNKEIASTLFMTEGSIRNVISSILLKTKLKSRTQLAVFAVKHNII
jgi:DNA-binding NarL/FixJ family response regulator